MKKSTVAVIGVLVAATAAGVVLSSGGGSSAPPSIRIQSSHFVGNGLFGGAPPANPAAGDILFASTGQWSGSPTGFAYLWEDCDSNGANCTTAAGSPTNTNRYVIVSGDNGFTIRVKVTASYSGHPDSSVLSQPTSLVGFTFADDFAGSSVDASKWVVLNQQGDTSNDEPQCYQPGLTTESGGSLAQTAQFSSTAFTCTAGTPIGSTSTSLSGTITSIPINSEDTLFWKIPSGGTVKIINGSTTASCTAPSGNAGTSTITVSSCALGATFPSGSVVVAPQSLNYKSGGIQQRFFAFTYGTLHIGAQQPAGGPSTTNGGAFLSGSSCQFATFLTPPGFGCNWPFDSSDAAEIDVWEDLGGATTGPIRETLVNGCLGGNCTWECNFSSSFDATAAFHDYELDWTPTQITWKIDGTTKCTDCPTTAGSCTGVAVGNGNTNAIIPTHPMFLIIKNAICPTTGSYCGTPSSSNLPQTLSIDYVHFTAASGAPENTGAPSVSGSTTHGSLLTANTGSWTNSPTSFTYQWLDCDSSGDNCAPISGATSSTYTSTASDVGDTIRVWVFASTSSGGTANASAQTAAIS